MILGVTGKIASGKSTVMNVLSGCGFKLIYTDKIVAELYAAGAEGAALIESNFGSEFLNSDGAVNRIALRELVFNDSVSLKKLNSVVHPIVLDVVKKQVSSFASTAGQRLGKGRKLRIAIESSYFLPGGLLDLIDELLWVERPRGDILSSLIARGFSESLALQAIDLIEEPNEVDHFLLNEGDILDKIFRIFNHK